MQMACPFEPSSGFCAGHVPIAHHSSSSSLVAFEADSCTLRRRSYWAKVKNICPVDTPRTPCVLLLVAVRSARGLVPFFSKQNVRRLRHSYLVIIHRIEYDNNRFAQIIFLLVSPSLFARALARAERRFLPLALFCRSLWPFK